jgi:hypothetical protein
VVELSTNKSSVIPEFGNKTLSVPLNVDDPPPPPPQPALESTNPAVKAKAKVQTKPDFIFFISVIS